MKKIKDFTKLKTVIFVNIVKYIFLNVNLTYRVFKNIYSVKTIEKTGLNIN